MKTMGVIRKEAQQFCVDVKNEKMKNIHYS